MRALPGLETAVLGRSWLHFDQLGSTNDYCKERAMDLPHGAVVTASLQTAGKGRLGRGWQEERDRGLALSLLLHQMPLQRLQALPLVAGLAVCRGLEALSGVRYQLKWSNDVLAGGKKICGILCESRLGAGNAFGVVGIGVNLRHRQADFDCLNLVYATSLFLATNRMYAPVETAAAILNAMEPLLDTYLAQGLGPLLPAYRERCVTLGKEVRVLAGGIERTGTALDIGESGALLCAIDGELTEIRAGEASVRGLYGYV